MIDDHTLIILMGTTLILDEKEANTMKMGLFMD